MKNQEEKNHTRAWIFRGRAVSHPLNDPTIDIQALAMRHEVTSDLTVRAHEYTNYTYL